MKNVAISMAAIFLSCGGLIGFFIGLFAAIFFSQPADYIRTPLLGPFIGLVVGIFAGLQLFMHRDTFKRIRYMRFLGNFVVIATLIWASGFSLLTINASSSILSETNFTLGSVLFVCVIYRLLKVLVKEN